MLEMMVYIVDIILLIGVILWYNKERIDVLDGFNIYDVRKGITKLTYLFVVWGVFKILSIVLLMNKHGFSIKLLIVNLNITLITLIIAPLLIKVHKNWMGKIFNKKQDDNFYKYKKLQYTYYYITLGSSLILVLIVILGLKYKIELIMLVANVVISGMAIVNYYFSKYWMDKLEDISDEEKQKRLEKFNKIISEGEYYKVGDSFVGKINKKVNKVYKVYKAFNNKEDN